MFDSGGHAGIEYKYSGFSSVGDGSDRSLQGMEMQLLFGAVRSIPDTREPAI